MSSVPMRREGERYVNVDWDSVRPRARAACVRSGQPGRQLPLEVERVVMEAKGSLAMRFQRAILHRGRKASGGQAFVPMMQAADLRNGDDVAVRRWLYGTILRAILFEGEMGPGSMVIIDVGR